MFLNLVGEFARGALHGAETTLIQISHQWAAVLWNGYSFFGEYFSKHPLLL